MKSIRNVLSRLDEIFSADELPFHKDKKPTEPAERISFDGFWKENFSAEAIKLKWNEWRESYSGNGEAAKKKRKLAGFRAVLMGISVILALLSTLISEYYFQLNGAGIPRKLVPFSEIMGKGMTVQAVGGDASGFEKAVSDAIDAAERDARAEKYVIDVPFYSQKEYPTGCELVSTSMLLAYYGIDITADEIVKDGYIKTKEVYLDKYGDPYGPDPDMYFIGDPLEDDGYGCYSGAIIAALKRILPKDEYDIVDLKGWSVDEICRKYINNDIPVLFWGSLNMEQTYFDEVNQWFIEDGKKKGEKFKWYSNEHCLVLVGHDRSFYYFNDPSASRPATVFGRPLVEVRYAEMGRQAIAIVPKD